MNDLITTLCFRILFKATESFFKNLHNDIWDEKRKNTFLRRKIFKFDEI